MTNEYLILNNFHVHFIIHEILNWLLLVSKRQKMAFKFNYVKYMNTHAPCTLWKANVREYEILLIYVVKVFQLILKDFVCMRIL